MLDSASRSCSSNSSALRLRQQTVILFDNQLPLQLGNMGFPSSVQELLIIHDAVAIQHLCHAKVASSPWRPAGRTEARIASSAAAAKAAEGVST